MVWFSEHDGTTTRYGYESESILRCWRYLKQRATGTIIEHTTHSLRYKNLIAAVVVFREGEGMLATQ